MWTIRTMSDMHTHTHTLKGKFRLNMIIYDIFTPYLDQYTYKRSCKKRFIADAHSSYFCVCSVFFFFFEKMAKEFSNNISHFYLTPLKIHVIAIKYCMYINKVRRAHRWEMQIYTWHRMEKLEGKWERR